MVDSRENRRTQPHITQTNYIESIEELNKMDIFVCGSCYFVAHFVEEFISHKEMPCERRDVIQPNTSDQKPQVWSFLLWKNAKHRANTQSSSWQLYQEWCTLPDATKNAWIEAGQFLKISSTMKSCYSGMNSKRFISDGILDEEELSPMKATIPNNPVSNSNKVMKKTRSGKYVELIVEKILAKRINNRRTEYWVKYKGRSAADEFKHWEPIESMSSTCQDMISSFESKAYLGQDSSGRKRTLSQTGNELNSAGLLNNVVGNKQKMEHVKQWVQDDTSGRIHGDDDVAKKKLRTDGSDLDSTEDYEEFFLRQKGGIILRASMKSCPKSTHSGGVTKKKNLAAEIGLESEEEEEEGGKENIFGRKNVPAVLKPNEQKVLVVNSQGVVALDPVEIPSLSSGIYIMTNKNEETSAGGEPAVTTSKPAKKPLNETGGYVVLHEHERSVKDTNNEALGRVTSHSLGPAIPPKMPNLTAFKSGALTITPSVRNISKDVTANNIIKRQTPNSQSQSPQSQSMQKILGPKNTTPKTRQVQYTSRSQPQITYLNSSGETTNKRILGSVNRYKATPDKQQLNHTEIQYTPSQSSKTVIKQEPQSSNLLIPASGYQLDGAGVTDTVMIKVEMSPGGTSQYVRGISGLESPHQSQVSGLKVKRIESPRKRNSNLRDSAHISILNRKDLAGGGSALAVPARKLKMFRGGEEEEGEEPLAPVPPSVPPSQPQAQEEMVTIAGEDGTLYQVASSELNGSAVLLTTGEDGQQQCLYVTDENGQPTILQGATIEGQEMLLDQAVYNEATGTIQMFQDQSGMETQVYQQDENGQLMPVDNPDEVLAQVQAAQQQEELLQQQQEQELAALQQQQELGHQQQELTPEQATELLQQEQEQQQVEGAAGSLEHVEGMQVAAEGGEQGGDSEVVAQLVEASEPSADGGPRKVVLLLSDGNLIQTEMSEEQFAALENS